MATTKTTGAGITRGEIVGILSLATDLVMGQPMGFGLRSCLVATRLAHALGHGAEGCAQVYYLAQLRYVGCTAQTDTLAALFGDEIALRRDLAGIDLASAGELLPIVFRHVRNANSGSPPLEFLGGLLKGMLTSRRASTDVLSGHCEAAARLGDRLGLGAGVVAGLGQLYERWDGKGLPGGLKAQAIEPAVRVVNFVHDAMVLAAGLTGEELVRTLRQRSGHAYAPDVVAAFIERREHLLDLPADEGVWEAALSRQPSPATAMTDAALDAALLVVADFIDLKSPSVAGHSRAVATLAERAGGILGLPSGDIANLKRAGLLHDLGFAAIPARLCLDEQAGGEQARLHPYYGERLLGRCPSLAPVTALVSEHHERLDGSGFHRGSREMSIPGRALAAAEAYQGLVENRPFRVSLSPRQAAQSLRDEVRRGALDGAAVDAVLEAAGHRLRNRKPLAVAGLTAREMEILRLVARGGSARAIASMLGVAPKTIDNHIQNIYGKIGVGTRAGATLFAVENGILMPGAEVGE